MPRLELKDFAGANDEERKAECFPKFTLRQKNRLENLLDPSKPLTEPSIRLESWEYAEWVNMCPENQELHDAIEIATAKSKAERAAKSAANVAKGNALAGKATANLYDYPPKKRDVPSIANVDYQNQPFKKPGKLERLSLELTFSQLLRFTPTLLPHLLLRRLRRLAAADPPPWQSSSEASSHRALHLRSSKR